MLVLFTIKDLSIAMLSFYLWPGRLFENKITFLKVFSETILLFFSIFTTWVIATYLICAHFFDKTEVYSYRLGEYLKFVVNLRILGMIEEWESFIYEISVLFIISASPRFLSMILAENINKIKLEKTQIEWELNLIKSQINPPLLFNTLNRIYYLLDKDTENGKNLIINLSNLMRYSLYDSKAHFIGIEREFEAVEDYLYLMQDFFHNRTKIIWCLQETNEPYKIRPLLLIPIINDVLKMNNDQNQTMDSVDIKINITHDKLLLSIIRNIVNDCDESRISEFYMDTQMELENTKKRLELYYKGKFEFSDVRNVENRHVSLVLILK